ELVGIDACLGAEVGLVLPRVAVLEFLQVAIVQLLAAGDLTDHLGGERWQQIVTGCGVDAVEYEGEWRIRHRSSYWGCSSVLIRSVLLALSELFDKGFEPSIIAEGAKVFVGLDHPDVGETVLDGLLQVLYRAVDAAVPRCLICRFLASE